MRILFSMGCWLLVASSATSADAPKRVLMLTKSTAFQHDVVGREKNGGLGIAELAVQKICKDAGYEIDVTKDASKLNAENLKKYGLLFFYTQGDLTIEGLDKHPAMKKADRQVILDFVKNGGAFVGTHCGGADTFNHDFWIESGKKPFCDMVGAEFIGHGEQQDARVEVVDPNFPAVSHWPAAFTRWDEWYAYMGFHENMHVLQMLKTSGMKGEHYSRPEYPITWCSNNGKGRVFYTGMGHVKEMWYSPDYLKMLDGAIKWGLGDVKGDATPNLKKLFGDEKKALERFNTIGKSGAPAKKAPARKPPASKAAATKKSPPTVQSPPTPGQASPAGTGIQ